MDEGSILRTVLDMIDEAVTVRSLDGALQYANEAAMQLIGGDWRHGRFVNEDGTPLADEDRPFARVLATGAPIGDVLCANQRADGSLQWLVVQARPLFGETGEMWAIVTSFDDVTLQRAAEQVLVQAALYDPLTGLANRRVLESKLDAALRRTDGRRSAAIFIDLDGFKAVNDTLGHGVGDQVLRAVAARLAPVVRADDVVARLGGDEFVVCCDGITAAGVELLTSRIADAVCGAPVPCTRDDGARVDVTVAASIGAAFAEEGETVASLLARADRAMYDAKRHRR